MEKPNDWSKEVKKSDSDESETKKFRYNYWVDFQDYAFQNKQFSNSFRKRKPSKDHWINFSLGSSICHLAVLLIPSRNELAVELNIPEDKDFFHRLYQNKQVIETETDLSFNWLELPEKKSSRIIINKSVDFNNFEQRVSQYDWLIDVMIKMKNEFKKYF